MSRPVEQYGELVNGDSFLDIVSSVIGIMLIMVVFVGVKIKRGPVNVLLPPSPVEADLAKDAAEEEALRGDVWKMSEEIRSLEHETAVRDLQRKMLAATVMAAEQSLDEHRRKLDAGKQADFDLAREIAACKQQLDELCRRRAEADAGPAAPIVVESYPTPISRSVDGPEAHLLIDNGRVAFVPLEELLERFQAQAQRQIYKLQGQPELTDTVGPVEGFRLRYTLERRDVTPEEFRATGRGGAYARLKRWTLIPTSNDLGEPARLALAEGSEFRSKLKKILPGRTTITIWVYPEGFDAFREIRRELYRQGYTIAARPLPPGEPIAGSPEGSKSAAQ